MHARARRRLLTLRDIPWLPVLACGLMTFKSHIPGGSTLQPVGFLLWLLYFVLLTAYVINRQVRIPALIQSRKLLPLIVLILVSQAGLKQSPIFLGFQLSKSNFNSFIQSHASEIKSGRQFARPINPDTQPIAKIGLYQIYDWGTGSNGEVFFITNIRRECTSGGFGYGFVYKPSSKENSFDYYAIRHQYLTGGWLSFADTGDWQTFECSDYFERCYSAEYPFQPPQFNVFNTNDNTSF